MYNRASHLAQLVNDLLGVPLAEKKLCFTGTSKPLMDACRAALGPLAGQPEIAVKNLGVDFSLGRHRQQAGHGKVRRRRFGLIKTRLKKLTAMK
eukprot:9410064-Pyramimonas_sp.AAC.1